MNDRRDPVLESVFAAAHEDALDETFTVEVMSGVDAITRWAWPLRIIVGLALVAGAALIAPVLQNLVGGLNHALEQPLPGLNESGMAGLPAPLNSLASAAMLVALGLLFSIRSAAVWLFK